MSDVVDFLHHINMFAPVTQLRTFISFPSEVTLK